MANDYERNHGEEIKRRRGISGMRKREAENTSDHRRACIVSRSSVGDAFLLPFAEREIIEEIAEMFLAKRATFRQLPCFRSRRIFNSTQC